MRPAQRFAFVIVGSGDYLGSTVRDLSIANTLHRRGFKVVVYWMMEVNAQMADPGIEHRMLCHGTRYHFQRPSDLLDKLGSALFLLPQAVRLRIVQGQAGYVDRLITNLTRALYATPDADSVLAERLSDFIAKDQVNCLMLSFASLGPLALAAKKLSVHQFDYLLTFQGDEQFAAHAQRLGILAFYCERLNDALRQSPWPAVVVSHDYVERIVDEMQVPRPLLSVIYNGIELPAPERHLKFSELQSVFPGLVENIPIVAYLGRQDSEKGIDLLLYAARLLAARKIQMQLVICGSTAKGQSYRKVLEELAAHLGLFIHHAGSVSPQVRDALYAHSRCVVYPSINREPFGLVVAEAMSHGTPVLVPNYGGVGEVILQGEHAGGLTFETWDSGDVARQLERLLVDETLYSRLVGNTRMIAARFGVDKMTDDVLAHIGVGARKAAHEER